MEIENHLVLDLRVLFEFLYKLVVNGFRAIGSLFDRATGKDQTDDENIPLDCQVINYSDESDHSNFETDLDFVDNFAEVSDGDVSVNQNISRESDEHSLELEPSDGEIQSLTLTMDSSENTQARRDTTAGPTTASASLHTAKNVKNRHDFDADADADADANDLNDFSLVISKKRRHDFNFSFNHYHKNTIERTKNFYHLLEIISDEEVNSDSDNESLVVKKGNKAGTTNGQQAAASGKIINTAKNCRIANKTQNKPTGNAARGQEPRRSTQSTNLSNSSIAARPSSNIKASVSNANPRSAAKASNKNSAARPNAAAQRPTGAAKKLPRWRN